MTYCNWPERCAEPDHRHDEDPIEAEARRLCDFTNTASERHNGECGNCPELSAALRAARAEGRREGLREAAKLACAHCKGSHAWIDSEPAEIDGAWLHPIVLGEAARRSEPAECL